MPSYTREQLEEWIQTIEIKADSKILDIGGSQKPAKGRITRGDIFEFTILDLEKPHEGSKPDIICDLNIGIPCENDEDREYTDTMPEYSYNDESKVSIDKFDVALCFEVAEYWWNPYQALKNIAYFLKKDGALFISVPTIYPVHNPVEQDYLRYTEKGIIKLLENVGFDVIDCEQRKARYPELLTAFFDTEGMKANKEYENHSTVGWLISAVKK